MSGMEDVKEQVVDTPADSEKAMPSSQQEEAVIKKKYGGIMPKKPPLISKDHERAYFDSADWALGKQGVEKPKGPLEALRPKLQKPRMKDAQYIPAVCFQRNSKHDIENLHMLHQMVKEGGTPNQRMQLQMNEAIWSFELLRTVDSFLISNRQYDCISVVSIKDSTFGKRKRTKKTALACSFLEDPVKKTNESKYTFKSWGNFFPSLVVECNVLILDYKRGICHGKRGKNFSFVSLIRFASSPGNEYHPYLLFFLQYS